MATQRLPADGRLDICPESCISALKSSRLTPSLALPSLYALHKRASYHHHQQQQQQFWIIASHTTSSALSLSFFEFYHLSARPFSLVSASILTGSHSMLTSQIWHHCDRLFSFQKKKKASHPAAPTMLTFCKMSIHILATGYSQCSKVGEAIEQMGWQPRQ